MQGITPFVWFDSHAEEAANQYVSIFPDSKIETITEEWGPAIGPAGLHFPTVRRDPGDPKGMWWK